MDDAKTYWWMKDESPHEDIFAAVNYIDANQSYRSEDNFRHMRLYGNKDVLGTDGWKYDKERAHNKNVDRLTYNVVQSCCDTVTNKISKTKPRPLFLTEGGDYSQARRAKLLTKFMEGQFLWSDTYKCGRAVFRDATIFDLGAMKVYSNEDDKIICERVFPEEIKVDHIDGLYGCPQTLYQVKLVPKESMKYCYPDFVQEIEGAGVDGKKEPTLKSDIDVVRVIEAWHLPQSDTSDDGRHVICIDNATLLDDEWDRPRFPFAFMRWKPRLTGFYGQPLAEELRGIQVEINRTLRTITQSLRLCSVPIWKVAHGSKVNTAHLTNDIGLILFYQGIAPELVNTNAVPPELFSHVERLVSRAYQITGISELSAQAKKPSGLDSGKALREFSDIESERFVTVGQDWEDFYMDVAELMIDESQAIYERDKSFGVLIPDGKNTMRINWADVNMDRDKYLMKIFPTSILPTTPAGKLQQVQELMQAGFLNQEQGLKLLDFPDLEEATDSILAASRNVDSVIERIIVNGEYIAPEPFQDLRAGIKAVQQAYLDAKLSNVSEDRLDLLRMWVEQATEILQIPMQAQAQAMPGPVVAKPESAPTSDLIPFGGQPPEVPAGAVPQGMPPVA